MTMRYVKITDLKPGMILAEDIRDYKDDLLLAKGQVLSPSNLTRLITAKYEGAFITDDYPEDSQDRGIISKKLNEDTVSALGDFFRIIDKGNYAGTAQAFDVLRHHLDKIIDEILHGKRVGNTAEIEADKEDTYYHCVNVAALSIMAGMAANLNRKGLYKLGMGALLHDLGKIFVPKEIITKSGPLSNIEFEEMKKHSQLGSDFLRKKWELPVESIIGVLTHHERFDGSGYPFRLPAPRQTIEGKIIAVCDVYDAMTSEKPYRKAITPSEAFEYLIGNSSVMFDPEIIISYFTKVIVPYPVGTRVILSNGIKATVIENYPYCLLRPKVVIDNIYAPGVSSEKLVLDLFNDPFLLNVTIIGLDK